MTVDGIDTSPHEDGRTGSTDRADPPGKLQLGGVCNAKVDGQLKEKGRYRIND